LDSSHVSISGALDLNPAAPARTSKFAYALVESHDSLSTISASKRPVNGFVADPI
jgi:hypothetical protein